MRCGRWTAARTYSRKSGDWEYLAALVAQDGLECCVIPWDAFDVLFVGGTTQWKLSDPAYVLVREAKGSWQVGTHGTCEHREAIPCRAHRWI